MGKEPWHNLGETSAARPQQLSYQESLETPCASCSTAACCTYLPLLTVTVDSLATFDHMRYLLNFENIELGINADGNWSAFYRYPCRFFDRKSHHCELHESPDQPRVCTHYSPYKCWYRKALGVAGASEYIRVDRRRLEIIASQIVFDDDRRIVGVPEWTALVAAFEAAPMAHDASAGGAADEPSASWHDPIFDSWRSEALASKAERGGKTELRDYAELADPCSDCAAYCCKNLLFPLPLPQSATAIDYLKFCLGFPGIEIGIAENQWSVIVKSRCQHLDDDDRCRLYGQPERPLLCKYYDAGSCAYKWQFGESRPEGFFRVRLEQFDAVVSAFEFDASGQVILFPPAQMICDAIENSWKPSGEAGAAGQPEYAPLR